MPTVSGFLGGITTTVMVVIMQSKDRGFLALTGVDYNQILLAGLAIISTLFIFTAFFAMLSSKYKKETGVLAPFLIGGGMWGLLALFPLLLLPSSYVTAAILVAIESIITCRWMMYVLKD